MALHSAGGVRPTSHPHGCTGGCTEPGSTEGLSVAPGNTPTCFDQPANAGFLFSLSFSVRREIFLQRE